MTFHYEAIGPQHLATTTLGKQYSTTHDMTVSLIGTLYIYNYGSDNIYDVARSPQKLNFKHV